MQEWSSIRFDFKIHSLYWKSSYSHIPCLAYETIYCSTNFRIYSLLEKEKYRLNENVRQKIFVRSKTKFLPYFLFTRGANSSVQLFWNNIFILVIKCDAFFPFIITLIYIVLYLAKHTLGCLAKIYVRSKAKFHSIFFDHLRRWQDFVISEQDFHWSLEMWCHFLPIYNLEILFTWNIIHLS